MEIKAEYRSEWGKQYLVLEGAGEDYQVQMLRNNQIPGLLTAEQREWNNQSYYYYNLTDCICLKERFQKNAPEAEEIRKLLQKIAECSKEAEKYLLDGNDFLLGLEYIYCKENGTTELVCFPGYQRRQEEQLCRLLEEIMECMDYRKRDAVSLVYLLYSRSRQSECTVVQLLSLCDEIVKAETVKQPKPTWVEPLQPEEKERKIKGLQSVWQNLKTLRKRVMDMYAGEKGKKTKPGVSEREQVSLLEQEALYTTETLAEMEMETVLLSEVVQVEEYKLEAMEEKQENISISRFPFYFGKEKRENGYCFSNGVISRKHAKLHREGEQFFLTDLNSKNGTYLNGERLQPMECRLLSLGDLVGFADIYYIFTCSKTSNIL